MKKLIVLGLFFLGVGAFFYFDLGRYLNLASLKENKDALLSYTNSHPVGAVIFFVLIYTAQTALSLPGATIMTLTSGFLFGGLLGTFYVNIGATLGATLAFLSARYLFRDLVEQKFGGTASAGGTTTASKRLQSLQMGFSKNGFNYLLTLRLIPLFPFFLVNLASGLTRIRLTSYVGATALGIIPASFVYCNAGQQLGTINTLKDIASPQVLGAFALLGLLALVPIIYQKFKTPSLPKVEGA